MNTDRKGLTPPEVASLYGVEPAKVIAWIRAGELPAVNLATRPDARRPRYRIREADLDVFEQRRAVKPPSPPATRRPRRTSERVFFS